jgi:UDP-N-acetylmuramoylalanine--D-glutamate ligase
MQQVARRDLVSFVNDSKATNADAAEKALSSFENIYWIAGGIAKSGGIESLQPYFGRIAHAYLIGLAAPDFAKSLAGQVPTTMCQSLGEAVAAAANDAGSHAEAAVVLLSPACASFDHYKNFEIRGDAFVEAVSRLENVHMIQGGKT